MKTITTGHAYDQYRREHPDNQTSEGWRIRQAEHFQAKFSREVFKMTKEEKQELKTRMYRYPNKNHRPIPPNN